MDGTPKKYTKVNEQVLKDFAVTLEGSPNLTEKEILTKFPEFENDVNAIQSARDYWATVGDNPTVPKDISTKFPEFDFGGTTPDLKKKGSTELPVDGGSSGLLSVKFGGEDYEVNPTTQEVLKGGKPVTVPPHIKDYIEKNIIGSKPKDKPAEKPYVAKGPVILPEDYFDKKAMPKETAWLISDLTGMDMTALQNSPQVVDEAFKDLSAYTGITVDKNSKPEDLTKAIGQGKILRDKKRFDSMANEANISPEQATDIMYKQGAEKFLNGFDKDLFALEKQYKEATTPEQRTKLQPQYGKLKKAFLAGYNDEIATLDKVIFNKENIDGVPLSEEVLKDKIQERDLLKKQYAGFFKSADKIVKELVDGDASLSVLDSQLKGKTGQQKLENIAKAYTARYVMLGRKLGIKPSDVLNEGNLRYMSTDLGDKGFVEWGLDNIKNYMGYGDLDGKVTSHDRKEFADLHSKLKIIMPILLINKTPLQDKEDTAGSIFTNRALGVGTTLTAMNKTGQDQANLLNDILAEANITTDELTPDAAKTIDTKLKEYGWGQSLAEMGGSTASILLPMMLGSAGTRAAIESLALNPRTAMLARFLLTKPVGKVIQSAGSYSLGGAIGNDSGELDAGTGAVAGGVDAIVDILGKKYAPLAKWAIATFGKGATKVAASMVKPLAKGVGEFFQESSETLYQTWRDTPDGQGVMGELQKMFPDADSRLKFVVGTTVMGTGMGMAGDIGFNKTQKKRIAELSPENRAKYDAWAATKNDKAVAAVGEVIPKATTDVIEDNLKDVGEAKTKLEKIANRDTDAEDRVISDFQQRTGYEPTLIDDVPERIDITLARMDNDEFIEQDALDELSDWAYEQYKKLSLLKKSDARKATIPQIQQAQDYLGGLITKIENDKNDKIDKGDLPLSITNPNDVEIVDKPKEKTPNSKLIEEENDVDGITPYSVTVNGVTYTGNTPAELQADIKLLNEIENKGNDELYKRTQETQTPPIAEADQADVVLAKPEAGVGVEGGKKSIPNKQQLIDERLDEIVRIKKAAEGTREEQRKRYDELVAEHGDMKAIEMLNKEISDRANAEIAKLEPIPTSWYQDVDKKATEDFNKITKELGFKDSDMTWNGTPLGDDMGSILVNDTKDAAIYIKPHEEEIYDETEDITETISSGIEIEFLNTKDEARGKGKAKQLLEKVVKWADANGTDLFLTVAPQDKSTTKEGLKNLYEGYGFVFDGEKGVRKPVTQTTQNQPQEGEVKETKAPAIKAQVVGTTNGFNTIIDGGLGKQQDPRFTGEVQQGKSIFKVNPNNNESSFLDISLPSYDTYGRNGGIQIRFELPNGVDANTVFEAVKKEAAKLGQLDAKDPDFKSKVQGLVDKGIAEIQGLATGGAGQTAQVKEVVSDTQVSETTNVNPALKNVASTATALSKLDKGTIDATLPMQPLEIDGYKREYRTDDPISIAEAYHKAKADKSNPDLVKAVEELLAPKGEVELNEGDKVGVRLNLNIRKTTGENVLSVHDRSFRGKVLGYSKAMTLRNVKFSVNENAAEKIASGESDKFPMASVDGEYVKTDKHNTDGVEIYFNPKVSKYFVDSEGKPVASAKEVSVIGNKIYATDIKYKNEGLTSLPLSELNKIPKGRLNKSAESKQKLKEDISKNGIQEPLVLIYSVKDNALRLKEGHHRLDAANSLGLTNVPVKVQVEWNKSIKDDSDIQGQKLYRPPSPLDVEGYKKRNYQPTNIELGELGFKEQPLKEAPKGESKKNNVTLQDGTKENKSQKPNPTVVQQGKEADTEGTDTTARNEKKREAVKSDLKRLRDEGLLKTADKTLIGKAKKLLGVKSAPMSDAEIDAQMALLDAMADVWKKTTGKDNFYDTFIADIKKGNLAELKKMGGVLFQDTENPTKPISKVTLAVFEQPLFEKMKGSMVAPQAISDLVKSRGKQIEKDIINMVLDFDKYKGQKRISFDEFRGDVETQIMKLEKIRTNTHADYGYDNLGDNEDYGDTKSVIFNSPIEHGVEGHFPRDFTTSGLDKIEWELRQIPNTKQWAAVDKNMPAGVTQDNITEYVGTAGSKSAVEKWIADRGAEGGGNINKGLFGHIREWFNKRTGVFHIAELQSDYYQKNKASDLMKPVVSDDEVNAHMNKNVWQPLHIEIANKIKNDWGITTKRVGNVVFAYDNKGKQIALSPINTPLVGLQMGEHEQQAILTEALFQITSRRAKSDKLADGLIEVVTTEASDPTANKVYFKTEQEAEQFIKSYDGRFNGSQEAYDEIKQLYRDRRAALQQSEEQKFIQKRQEELAKDKPTNIQLKQFVASQKVHELRLLREALKMAAEEGATTVRFPAQYTLAVIEAYTDATGEGNAPYEIINGDSDRLYEGDEIDYGGERMIVVEQDRTSITVAPKDEVSVMNYNDLVESETDNRVDEIEYEANRHFDDFDAITKEEVENYEPDEWMGDTAKTLLEAYFEENEDAETVKWDDIKSDLYDSIRDVYGDMQVEDLASWSSTVWMDGDTIYALEGRNYETFNQPNEYEASSSKDDYYENLSREQKTVVDKYGELAEQFQKMRPDARTVVDDNGMEWLETDVTEADKNNPIVAFQEEGGKVKGAIDFTNDNRATLHIFDGADISTLAHEMSGHLGRRVLEKLAEANPDFAKQYEAAKKWAGVKDVWTTKAEEKFARGFEKYLREGKAPTTALKEVFGKLKEWLSGVYNTIKGSSIDIKLTDDVRNVFDTLLGKEMQAKAAPKKAKKAAIQSDMIDILVGEAGKRRDAYREITDENIKEFAKAVTDTKVIDKVMDAIDNNDQLLADLEKKLGMKKICKVF